MEFEILLPKQFANFTNLCNLADFWSLLQGIIKAFDHKRKDALIATDNFVRAFELRLPNKKYVMQNIQAIVDKVKRGPDKAEFSAASSGGGGSSSSSWKVILDDVDRKCFLLAVASVLPFPDQECAQQMITQAANVGIKMGSETKIHLKSAIEERESFGKTSLDKKVFALPLAVFVSVRISSICVPVHVTVSASCMPMSVSVDVIFSIHLMIPCRIFHP